MATKRTIDKLKARVAIHQDSGGGEILYGEDNILLEFKGLEENYKDLKDGETLELIIRRPDNDS